MIFTREAFKNLQFDKIGFNFGNTKDSILHFSKKYSMALRTVFMPLLFPKTIWLTFSGARQAVGMLWQKSPHMLFL